MRWLLLLTVLSTAALAQQLSPCTTRCNQQASDCMKTCAGDPKDAQAPGKAGQLMECMKRCAAGNTTCKSGCGETKPPPRPATR